MKNIIVKPIITEKSMVDAEKSKFTFEVAMHADKPMIKKAIEDQFTVNIIGVITTIVKGRTKRAGKNRQKVSASSYKKAIVQLQSGQKIGLFELGS